NESSARDRKSSFFALQTTHKPAVVSTTLGRGQETTPPAPCRSRILVFCSPNNAQACRSLRFEASAASASRRVVAGRSRTGGEAMRPFLPLLLVPPPAAEPLKIVGPDKSEPHRLVRLQAAGDLKDAALVWDVFPEEHADIEELPGGRLLLIGPPGTYKV